MKAAVTELGRRVRGKKLAAIGFCLGGGMIWRLLAAKEPRLSAAGLEHEILTFAQADHAFFNHTGARFNAPAAAEAWRRVIAWYDAAEKHRHGKR